MAIGLQSVSQIPGQTHAPGKPKTGGQDAYDTRAFSKLVGVIHSKEVYHGRLNVGKLPVKAEAQVEYPRFSFAAIRSSEARTA